MIAKRHLLRIVAVIALLALLPIGAAQAGQAAREVAEPFRDYYAQHQGIRVLGYPLTDLLEVDSYPAQYFEKGRIEDHRSEITNPKWAFMYGRLAVELVERNDPDRLLLQSGLTMCISSGSISYNSAFTCSVGLKPWLA